MPATASCTAIAVIDDDASVCRALLRLLDANDLHGESFPDGSRAWQALQKRRFDCILLDVRMPHPDGVELHARLRNDGCTTPVIFMSANDDGELESKLLKGGAFAFLRKPCEAQRLIALVRLALAKRPA